MKTEGSNLDLVLDAFLADGPEQIPDRVVDAALNEVEHTHQRRAPRVPWRFSVMPNSIKIAAAAAAVVAVAVGGLFLLRPGGEPGAGGNQPSPSPTPHASPTQPTITFSESACTVTGPALSTNLGSITFISERPQYVAIDIWRIGQGKTYDELVAELAVDQARIEQGLALRGAPAYLTMATGEILEIPATESRLTTLTPGTYAITCIAFADDQAFADNRPLSMYVVGPIEVTK